MADIIALKRRRAAFYASGQVDKARAVDAEIARRRGVAVPDPVPVPRVERGTLPVEVAVEDLSAVETASVRRRPGRPRKD